MRYALLATLILGTTSFSPTSSQVPQDLCLVRVVNLTPFSLRVLLWHGDVALRYKEVIENKDTFTIQVPCHTPPVTLAVVNTKDQTDFQTRVLKVPPPGMVQVWCLGSRGDCEAYREAESGTYNNIRKRIT